MSGEQKPDPLFDVRSALRKRYPKDAYALMFEVRNATGFEGSRSADAVAMGLWPSRGLELEGFEFKASRGDWLNELKQPEKAEEIAQYCDRWWVVATKPGIVKASDLPPTWGLLVPFKGGLKAQVKAPLLENPTPMTKGFIASLFRETQKQNPSAESWVEAEVQRRLTKDRAFQHKWLQQDLERAKHDLKNLREVVTAFEVHSGVTLSRWIGEEGAKNIGKAVKIVANREDNLGQVSSNLNRTMNVLDMVRKELASAQKMIQGVKDEPPTG